MDEENNIYSDLGADDLAEKFDSQLANDERGKIAQKVKQLCN